MRVLRGRRSAEREVNGCPHPATSGVPAQALTGSLRARRRRSPPSGRWPRPGPGAGVRRGGREWGHVCPLPAPGPRHLRDRDPRGRRPPVRSGGAVGARGRRVAGRGRLDRAPGRPRPAPPALRAVAGRRRRATGPDGPAAGLDLLDLRRRLARARGPAHPRGSAPRHAVRRAGRGPARGRGRARSRRRRGPRSPAAGRRCGAPARRRRRPCLGRRRLRGRGARAADADGRLGRGAGEGRDQPHDDRPRGRRRPVAGDRGPAPRVPADLGVRRRRAAGRHARGPRHAARGARGLAGAGGVHAARRGRGGGRRAAGASGL